MPKTHASMTLLVALLVLSIFACTNTNTDDGQPDGDAVDGDKVETDTSVDGDEGEPLDGDIADGDDSIDGDLDEDGDSLIDGDSPIDGDIDVEGESESDSAEDEDAEEELEEIPQRIHAHDGHIRDPLGRAIYLQSLTISNEAKNPATGFLGNVTQEDFNRVHEWGFNAIRLVSLWEAIEPQPGEYDETYLAEFDKRVRWAVDAGLLVILDMHQDLFGRGFEGGNGAPLWACDEEYYATFTPTDPWALAYLSDEIIACYDNFWGDETLQTHFVEAWATLAARYADEPAVIGCELLAEPFWGSHKVATFEKEVLQPLYERVINRLSEVLPGRLFFVDPITLTQLGSLFDSSFETFDCPDVVYTPHYFDQRVHEGEPYPGNEELLDVIPAFRDTAQRLGTPWFMGSYGGSTRAEGFTDYLRDIWDLMGVSSSGASYFSIDRGDFGLLDSEGNMKTDVLHVLTRPHPRALGGAPVSLAYDDTQKTLTIIYDELPRVENTADIWVGRDLNSEDIIVHEGNSSEIPPFTYNPENGIVRITPAQHQPRHEYTISWP